MDIDSSPPAAAPASDFISALLSRARGSVTLAAVPGAGRGLLAARAFSAGEVLFVDSPFVCMAFVSSAPLTQPMSSVAEFPPAVRRAARLAADVG